VPPRESSSSVLPVPYGPSKGFFSMHEGCANAPLPIQANDDARDGHGQKAAGSQRVPARTDIPCTGGPQARSASGCYRGC
jgi:hypothetical protein